MPFHCSVRLWEDDAHNPRYVETIATRGTADRVGREAREWEDRPPVSNSGPSVPTEPEIVEAKGSASSAPRRRQHRYPLRWTLPTALAIVALAFAGISLLREARSPPANAAPAGIIRSMAVLPFSDLSSDAADQYFAAGLTEALITRLSRSSELRVISTTSAETFRGTNRPPMEIAKDLGVEAVLEGSVVQSQDRVRVYVQLVATETGEYLWTQEYDRELSDILYLHAAIGQAVADAVRLRLTPREVSALAHSGSVDSEAYRLYLRGRFHWNRRTIADLERSLEHFQQALDLDPTFAPAQAGLADTYVLLSTYYALTPAEAFPPARAAAERALVLGPDLPEAYASLGAVHLIFDWDFSAAGDAYRRALDWASATLRHINGMRSCCPYWGGTRKPWPRGAAPGNWTRFRRSSTRLSGSASTRRPLGGGLGAVRPGSRARAALRLDPPRDGLRRDPARPIRPGLGGASARDGGTRDRTGTARRAARSDQRRRHEGILALGTGASRTTGGGELRARSALR